MNLWPWQSLKKELDKRLEESKALGGVTYSPEEFFETLRNIKLPFYKEWWIRFKWWANDFSWTVYRFFDPCNKNIRKAIPRKWMDLDELIRVVNFEIFLQFYDQEFKSGLVEFDSEFSAWVEMSHMYITSTRKEIQNKIRDEFERLDKLPYKEKKYDLIWELEKEIEDTDTELLINMMKYRGHFWS